jgi:hypothetical protein
VLADVGTLSLRDILEKEVGVSDAKERGRLVMNIFELFASPSKSEV